VKLFMSWSKPRSNQVALLLREWIPSVVQRVEPWMSSEDIDKGQRWGAELSELLATTSQGLVCVTADNVFEPWLNFEAGALAKSVTVARVRPVLLDIRPVDVTGPLAQFQATSLTVREDVAKLIDSLNAGTDKPVEKGLLHKAFDRAWPEFDEAVNRLARTPADGRAEPPRRPEEKIDEILDLVRTLQRQLPAVPSGEDVEVGDVVVDLSGIDSALGVVRCPVYERQTVAHFLNELFAELKGAVPAYTYGTRWELYDPRRGIALADLGSAWSRGNRDRPDLRRLDDVGLRAGSILVARLIAAPDPAS
jgi:hypothetical protein